MKVKREYYKRTKDLPSDEFLTPGTPLCAGCGGLATLRLVHKILGENVVIVNAAGCMTLMAVYPFTPLRSSWLYTTIGSAAAGAQGIRDALDVLTARGALEQKDDLKVLVVAGDGSTDDMGCPRPRPPSTVGWISGTSAMTTRRMATRASSSRGALRSGR